MFDCARIGANVGVEARCFRGGENRMQRLFESGSLGNELRSIMRSGLLFYPDLTASENRFKNRFIRASLKRLSSLSN